MSVAAASLLLGWLLAYWGKQSRAVALAHSAAILVFIILSAMFLSADYFTGQGIDESVLYHTIYGLEGAGFSEYAPQLVAALLLLLAGVGAAVVSALVLHRRPPQPARRVRPTGVVSLGFALAACVLNPATRDLGTLAGLSLPIEVRSAGAEGTPGTSFGIHYRAPVLENTPEKRRNLVFIYAEGLEQTYLDESLFPGLIVGLRELEKVGTSFSDISQTSGTSFTIGGMVGSQCGIPLVTASSGNSMGGMEDFLPKARCLGDLLATRGYELNYLGGASLEFAGKGKFLRGHGFKDVQGREELLPALPDPSYRSGWGLHDDTLLDIAYERFKTLAARPKPFGLFLLTLDTHHPDGHISNAVAGLEYEDGGTPILNAVAGADRLLSRFVRRVLDSPHANDTLIVICSDHLALQNGATERLQKGRRRNLFMIIDPTKLQAMKVEKPGTTLDIGPTVLHAMGFRANLGLGRDLLGQEPTLREQLPDLGGALAEWREELSGFWGVSKMTEVAVHGVDGTLELEGKTLRGPVLLTFDADMRVTVYFDSHPPLSLKDYVSQMELGTPFVWLDDCSDAAAYAGADQAIDSPSSLCVTAGRRGARPAMVKPADSVSLVSEEGLRSILESTPEAQLYDEQRARLVQAQLPEGFTRLLDDIPSRSIYFFSQKDRTQPYAEAYAQSPYLATKNLQWTRSLPEDQEFYFAAPSLKEVWKTRRYTVRRLPVGADLATALRRHDAGVVVLSAKGDMRALSPGTLEYLFSLGIDLRAVDKRGSFAAVLDKGVVVAHAVDAHSPVILEGEDLERRGIERVESAGQKLGNFSKIVIKGRDISKNGRGLNIAFLDPGRKPLVTNVDTHMTERLGGDIYKATPVL